MKIHAILATALMASTGMVAAPAAASANRVIANDMSKCDGRSPAIRVVISGIKGGGGVLRVQSYRGTASDWLEKGRWLTRTEIPARAGTMTVCIPVSGPGQYAVAVRHDVNGNGKTDLRTDGGGMSNNPSINVLNLGKPSVSKTRFSVGETVESIAIRMRYL